MIATLAAFENYAYKRKGSKVTYGAGWIGLARYASAATWSSAPACYASTPTDEYHEEQDFSAR